MRRLGIGLIGRVGALALGIATMVACGDNGVTPPDAPDIDAPPPAPAVITMTPTSNDFGSVVIGNTSSAATFTITNTGEEASGAITPVISGANASEFTAANGCSTLTGGGTCTITVTFTPTASGTKAASLVVNASPGGTVMATLLATGQTPGTLSIAPSSLAFGNVVTGVTSTSQTFTISNTGNVATGTLTVTKAGSDPAEFTAGADTCNGMTLAGGASCTVEVAFSPSSAGAKSASFVVTGSPGGSVNGAVTGNGLAPAQLAVSPTLQDFGTTTVGTNSANVTFIVTNVGGVTTSALSHSITTGDNTQFSIVSGNCSGTTLAPAASCNVLARFNPTTPGLKATSLNVTATTGGTVNASLLGTGVAAGQIAFTSPMLPFAFPSTTVGQSSTSQIFTVTNQGGSATGALGTALGGTDPSQFTIVNGSNGCQGVILAAGGTCTIAVVFGPTSGGAKSANLTVTGTPGGTTVANITGTGVAPAQFALSPASRDFGSVVTGEMSAFQTFTLTNIGGQNSGVPAVTINGVNASQFAMSTMTPCPAALTPAPAAGSSCTIQVRFSPTTMGAKVASLDVTASAGGSVSSGLSGDGVAQAALAVTPTTITFPGVTNAGDSSGTQSFTVTNNGSQTTGTLTIVSTTPGANPGDFTQTNNCTTLIAGAQCTVVVTFSPTAAGNRTATIQVSGTPGGSVGVAVNGNSLPRLEILTPTPVTIPNTFNFGTSPVNPISPAQVLVTVRNNTASSQTLTNTETPSSTSFTQGAGCTGALAAGANCTFMVSFVPQQSGALSEPYVISSGAGAFNQATQQVNGVGSVSTLTITDAFGAQLPDTTPTSHAFGNRGTNSSSAPRVFRVGTTSAASTGALTVDLTGAGYQILSNGCSGITLSGAGTCDISVVFTPTAAAAQNATITVRASQGDPVLGGMVQAMLTGTGVAPTPLVTPASIDFGTLFAGDVSPANTERLVTVTNPNAVATNLSFVMTGASAFSDFNPGGAAACGSSLAAGASCTRGVRFSVNLPATTHAGTLTVTQSIGGQSMSVSLAGASRSTISLSTPAPFVNVVVGSTASRTLTVTNNSPQTLTGFSVTAATANFFILNNTCATLAPAATCTFDLSFQPTSGGSQPVLVRASTGSPATGDTSVLVAATAITGANLTVAPSVFDFGSEISGQNGASQVFTFTNLGEQSTGAFSPTTSPATNWSVQATTCGAALAGGASCTATVRFNPTATGMLVANLTATATPGGTAAASLTGTGIAAGGVRVTETAFTYPDTTAGSSELHMFLVQNTSGASTATLANTTGANPDFTPIAGGTCGATLAPGASCTVVVRFNPVTPGFKTGTLTVVAGSTFAALYGRGLTVANVTSNVGGTYSNTNVITSGDGFGQVNGTSITVSGISGTVSSLSVRIPSLTLHYPGISEIVLESPNGERLHLMSDVGAQDFNTYGPFDMTIEDGASAELVNYSSGNFKPTMGLVNGGNPIWMSGERPAPAGTATLASTFGGTTANGVWTLYVANQDCCGSFFGTGPDFFTRLDSGWELSIQSVNFGRQTIGTTSGPRTVQLTNNGQTTASPLTGTVTGADASHYLISDGCNGVALAPGASCDLVLRFAPTTGGTKNAVVSYTGPVTLAPITITGVGVSPASLSITPSVVQNDGSRAIGDADTSVTTFTVSNGVGTSPTSAITFTTNNPANFTLSQADSTCALNGTQTLNPGTNCTVGVFFNPTQLGAQSGGFTASATAGGMVTGLMSGTGTHAITSLTASPVTFTSAAPGSGGSSQTITIRNIADVSTSLIQTTLMQTGGMDFSITTDNCGGRSLAPNTNCTISVQFVPSGTSGARSATLRVEGVVTGTTTFAAVTLQSTVL